MFIILHYCSCNTCRIRGVTHLHSSHSTLFWSSLALSLYFWLILMSLNILWVTSKNEVVLCLFSLCLQILWLIDITCKHAWIPSIWIQIMFHPLNLHACWSLPHQSTIKKMPTDLPICQSDGGISSTELSSSQVTFLCVKLTKTKQHMLYHVFYRIVNFLRTWARCFTCLISRAQHKDVWECGRKW